MKVRNKSRFDVGALRDLAGAQAFARGKAYFRDGQVTILRVEKGRVTARVAGSEDYRTVLTGRGEEVGGECSCPACEREGSCKHMVAVGLAVNAAGEQIEVEGSGALARIRDQLKAKGIDALVEMILGLAEQDTALFHKLDMAVATTHGDDKAVEPRLRRAIDDATRIRGYVGYREARGWAAGVDEALEAVADLVPAGRARIALTLANRAIDRIQQAFESIDDSDGHWGALLHHAGEVHLAAASAARPDPVTLARELFKRETESDSDAFSGAAQLYADVLGEAGLAEYRRLALAAWDKLPVRTGAKREFESSGDYYRLAGILDFFAERDGDVDARIALRAKDLVSPWSYLQLAEFCLSCGRTDEALRRAEEGLWMFEDDRLDERLLLFVVRLLSKAGRKADAEQHLWRAFERVPSLELFKQLRKLGGVAARDRALASLEARLGKKAQPLGSAAADLFVHVLMREKMFDAAWAAVRSHGVFPTLKESLARKSETTHTAEALATYAERVEQHAAVGGNTGYAEAAKLITRMATLRDAVAQAAYVATVRERHGRKRNFMKLLDRTRAPRRNR